MQISDKVFKYHAALLPFFLARHASSLFSSLVHDMPKKSTTTTISCGSKNVFFTEKKLKVKRKIR